MDLYVALLRGINVGGARKVAMADLRDLFSRLGHADVQTYVQSGNVVFGTARTPVASAIERAIAHDLGQEVTVLLRSSVEMAAIVAGNPFADRADPKSLHATLLVRAPERDRVAEVAARDFGDEELQVEGTTVYLHLPHGYGRTRLNNAFFERRLAVPATTRNWRTVTTLVDMTRPS